MIEKIKNLLLDENNRIIPQRTREHYLKKHDLIDFINNSFDDTYSLIEKIYCITHDCNRPLCKHCNKEIKFNYGYANFCSPKCRNNDPDVLNKNKIGVSKSLKITYNERGDLIKEKRNNTLFEKYGNHVTSPFSIKEIQDKAKDKIKLIYGVENVFYLKDYRANGRKLSQDLSIIKNKAKGYDIEYLDKNKILIKNLCKIHGDVEMDCTNFYNRFYRNRKGIKCPMCNPIETYSSLELEFEKIIKEIGVTNYVKNTKAIITPLELDFYFPDYKIAVELNGVYWHSDIHSHKEYHKIKTELCNKLGIRLFHIWEDDLYNKQELIKTMFCTYFKKQQNKIYARNCQIQNIDSKTYRVFLDENHIQGKINSSIRYGLYYNKELVSVMGFGKLRSSLGSKNEKNVYELQRFCSLKETIIGGASKLLNHFEKNIKATKIVSYAKRDYFNGDLYLKLGFKLDKICDPEYYWVIDYQRKHRYSFRKDKISNNENKHLSAIDIMHNNGFYRCFDSGSLKFIKENLC